jgi:hypothetical protein
MTADEMEMKGNLAYDPVSTTGQVAGDEGPYEELL